MSGVLGAQGSQGSQGLGGAQGAQGLQGTQGRLGLQGFSGAQGAVVNYTRITSNYTAVNRDQLIADTTDGTFTISLPAAPDTGDALRIADGNNWGSNNLTIGRNGSTIEGVADDVEADIGGLIIDLVYDGTTWEVYTSSGSAGALTASNTVSSETFYPVFVKGFGAQTVNIRVTSTAFSFNPSTCTLTAIDFNSTSDLKLKTNIKQISNSIFKIRKLKGITFNWKENNRPSVGVIAQDIEKVFPELVNEVNGEKTVNYNGLIGLLIESIKEQQTELELIKEKNNSLEIKVNKIFETP